PKEESQEGDGGEDETCAFENGNVDREGRHRGHEHPGTANGVPFLGGRCGRHPMAPTPRPHEEGERRQEKGPRGDAREEARPGPRDRTDLEMGRRDQRIEGDKRETPRASRIPPCHRGHWRVPYCVGGSRLDAASSSSYSRSACWRDTSEIGR